MALSAADKQRLYRERRDQDPQRRQNYLQKEKEKYEADKAAGKRKLVSSMTPREKRAADKKWRIQKRKQKNKKQKEQAACLTPPDTPQPETSGESRQKKQSIRKKNKERSKCYRDLEIMKQQLELAKKKADMYRKRWVRAVEATNNKETPNTPRTMTRKLLRNFSGKTVRKTLIFHHALIDQMRNSYQSAGLKKSISQILAGTVLKKYKFKSYARKQVGDYTRQGKTVHKKKGSLSQRLRKSVQMFFERDDVSRATSGKKNTITRKKMKKQKRLLNDSLINLHKKFNAENAGYLSYPTFCRIRPFWVVIPTERDRDTCLCKACENLKYLTEKLYYLNIIPKNRPENLISDVTCDAKSKLCMYGECPICKEKRINIQCETLHEQVSWTQWKTMKEKKNHQTRRKGTNNNKENN